MRLRVLSESAVRKVVTRKMVYEAVRQCFEAIAKDDAKAFDVAFGTGFRDGEVFGAKSGNNAATRHLGLKVGSYWPENRELPAHGSTTILLDPDTGFPSALVNAAYLNGYRTAAANAVATDALARPDASVLGVLGAGHQAEHEIRAVAEVRDLSLVKIATRSPERARWLQRRLTDFGPEVRLVGFEEAVRGSDLVTTVTPSREPLVSADWITVGTHISAMGADAPGKIELEPATCRGARLFADYPHQSIRLGEFEGALQAKIITSADHITAIGRVTLDLAPGRIDDEDVTIFDSSGIAVQDLAAAHAVLGRAEELGLVETIEF